MKKFRILSISILVVISLFTSCKNEVSGGDDLKVQGDVAKENILIGEKTYEKTTEIVVIPEGKTATINMTEEPTDYNGKGVFIKDRSVTLSPYAISAYQVTQELYEAVIGTNPSYFKNNPATGEEQKHRPVEYVTWYDAVNFCNELTKMTMTEADCVYYSDESITQIYEIGTSVYIDLTKKGYRLPTEAEWEFAARGGDPTAEDWKFAYSGVQTEKDPKNFTDSPYTDEKLEEFGWYSNNSGSKTHEVGKKIPNKLGLYDMSGNVREWCNDRNVEITIDAVINPLGSASGSNRVERGGSWENSAKDCSVSYRFSGNPNYTYIGVGFRLARSL